MLRKGEAGLLEFMKKKKMYQSLETSIVEYTGEKIRAEVAKYTCTPECIMKKVTAKDMEGFSLTVSALLVPVRKPWPNNASRPNVIPSTYWSELRLENKYTRCLCLTFNQNMS